MKFISQTDLKENQWTCGSLIARSLRFRGVEKQAGGGENAEIPIPRSFFAPNSTETAG